MTHTTEPFPATTADPAAATAAATAAGPHTRWASVRVSALAAGVVAAGLGLAVPVVAALALWIGSPYPDDGLGGALHVGAGLWLLAQGAQLVRTDTLSGDPAPLALTPLLLAAVPAWLMYRGTASAVARDGGIDEAAADGDPAGGGAAGGAADRQAAAADGAPPREPRTPDVRQAAVVAGWVLAGYLAVAVVATGYAAVGPVHVDLPSALYVPLFAAAAAACGAWSGGGRPPLAAWLRAPVPRRYADEAADALRAAAAGGAVLIGGGALIGAVALVCHLGAVSRTYGQLSGSYPGRIAVLLLALALVPNLAVWAASYALGTGFAVGAGSVVAPAGATGYPLLPAFPLLAALPGTGGGGPLGWATLAVPAAAGVTVAWSVAGVRVRPLGRTVRTVCGAALMCGLGFAVVAVWAGGAVGRDAMASFGPLWLRGAGAACLWVAVVGVPVAVFLRSLLAPGTGLRRLRLPRWLTGFPVPRGLRSRLAAVRAWRPGASRRE